MKSSIPLGFIRIFVLLIYLTSCGSKKQQKIALSTDFEGPKELARSYGVRVTPEDDVFLYSEGARWLGVRHKLGGSTKRGVDCFGFVSIVYREVYGKQLARSSANMLKCNCRRMSRTKLQEGDLISFKTGRGGKRDVPNHVGTYLKNGCFIHTNTSSSVMVSSPGEPYYIRTWLTGGRVK